MERRHYIDKDLRTIFHFIVKRIYVVIALMIIVGVAFGIYKGRSIASVNVQLQQAQGYISIETLEQYISEEKKNEAYAFYATYRNYAAFSNYMKNALIMKVDASAVPETIMYFDVTEGDANQIAELLRNFCDAEIQTKVEGIEVDQVLISTTEDADFVCVKVIGYDNEQATALAKEVQEAIVNKVAKMNAGSLVLKSQADGVFFDKDVLEKQTANVVAFSELVPVSKLAGETLQDAPLQLYKALCVQAQEEEPVVNIEEQQQEEIRTAFSKAHFVIGAIIGFVIGIAILFLFYTFRKVVLSENEMERIYDTDSFGSCAGASAEMVGAYMAVKCLNKKAENVLFVSTLQEEDAKESVELLVKILKEQGVSASFVNQATKTADGILAMAKTGNVIVLEKKDKSLLKELIDQKKVIESNEISVLGCAFI